VVLDLRLLLYELEDLTTNTKVNQLLETVAHVRVVNTVHLDHLFQLIVHQEVFVQPVVHLQQPALQENTCH